MTADLKVGAKVEGRYEVVDRLGEGGMGKVVLVVMLDGNWRQR